MAANQYAAMSVERHVSWHESCCGPCVCSQSAIQIDFVLEFWSILGGGLERLLQMIFSFAFWNATQNTLNSNHIRLRCWWFWSIHSWWLTIQTFWVHSCSSQCLGFTAQDWGSKLWGNCSSCKEIKSKIHTSSYQRPRHWSILCAEHMTAIIYGWALKPTDEVSWDNDQTFVLSIYDSNHPWQWSWTLHHTHQDSWDTDQAFVLSIWQ
jgi:hypothetical protein